MGAKVTGTDSSKPIIEIAKEREKRTPLGVRFYVADASNLEMLSDSSFDVILANMVIDDVEDAEGLLKECARVLREGGRFVASISHPCFDLGQKHSGWLMEKMDYDTSIWRKVGSNYRMIFSDTGEWKLATNLRMLLFQLVSDFSNLDSYSLHKVSRQVVQACIEIIR